MKKRKGYKDINQQIEANKRYLEKNPNARENRKRIVAKSQAKKFINDFASFEELKLLKSLIDEKIKQRGL